MDFSYFFKILLRRKWYILGLTFIAVLVAFVYLLFKKNLYESVAQYSTGFTAERVKLTDGSSAVDVYSADIKFNNVIETFKSPKVIGMLSYRLLLHDLDNSKEAFRQLPPEKRKSKEYKSVNIDTVRRILRNKLFAFDLLSSSDSTETRILEFLKLYNYDYFSIKEQLIVNRVERTDYLDVVFRSENPELSATVVNTLGQEFINYYKSLTAQRGEESASTIKELVLVQQRKVDSLSNLLLNAKVEQGSIDPVSMSTSAMETVTQLESKLAEAQANRYTYFQKLEYLKRRRDQLSTSSSSTSNAELLQLRQKRMDLVNDYAKKGNNDAGLKKQIDDLNDEIITKTTAKATDDKAKEELKDITNQINETQGNLTASEQTIRDYNSRIGQYKGMSNINPGSSVKIEVIQTQLDIENKQLESIKDKYSQAEGLIRDNPAVNIKQTLEGQPAVEPEPAKRIFTMGLAGMSMFCVSSVFFLFIAIFDTSIKSPSQFVKSVNRNLLAAVTQINLKNTQIDDIILAESGKSFSNHLFKQNLRKLRFELDDSGRKIFLFTSTQAGVGKTVIIDALSRTILLEKKKVLLIDTNFSHNSLTTSYSAKEVLENVVVCDQAHPFRIKDIATSAGHDGIDVIGCKGGNYTPSEVLKSNNLLEHLNKFTKDYDYIFLEGAALNNHSDSLELYRYVDAVIIVFSADSILGPLDNDSLQSTDLLKDKFLGAVLNKVRIENIDV
jgi:succinoglycan biosynthesis transport protein ExoP